MRNVTNNWIFIVVAMVGIVLILIQLKDVASAPPSVTVVACPAMARICPDGSTVGATGPNCDFVCPVVATTSPVIAAPADITLRVGQTGTVGGLSVTFNHFVQDSRCPVDVQCIQAGAVNINVTFASGTQTVTKNMPSDEVPQEFAGYSISIAGIAPPRKSRVEIDPKDYKITFHVSK